MERWPTAVPVDELVPAALERARPFLGDTTVTEAERGVVGDLFGCVMYGMVHLHSVPVPCTGVLEERPRAHPLAADYAEYGRQVVNAHHELMELDVLSHEVLRLCDGTRTRENMLASLVGRFEQGGLTLEHDKRTVTDQTVARDILGDRLDRVLQHLRQSAVLHQH
jgi:hypothetical protein